MGKMRITAIESERTGCLTRVLVALLLIVVLVLALGYFATPTEGGRGIVQKLLEREAGVQLTVGGARIGFPYVLVAEDVETLDFKPGQTAGFHADEIRIGLGLGTRFTVRATRCTLDLLRDKPDHWEPGGVFNAVGGMDVESPVTIARATRDLRRRVRLDVVDGLVQWLPTEDEPGGRTVRGLNLSVRPLNIPDRDVFYYRLSVAQYRRTNDQAPEALAREWIALDGNDYVEISRALPAAAAEPEKVRTGGAPADSAEAGAGEGVTSTAAK